MKQVKETIPRKKKSVDLKERRLIFGFGRTNFGRAGEEIFGRVIFGKENLGKNITGRESLGKENFGRDILGKIPLEGVENTFEKKIKR